MISFFPLQAEPDGTFQILKVLLVLSHGFSGTVGKLRHRAAVHILQLDHDIQRLHVGVIGKLKPTGMVRWIKLVRMRLWPSMPSAT